MISVSQIVISGNRPWYISCIHKIGIILISMSGRQYYYLVILTQQIIYSSMHSPESTLYPPIDVGQKFANTEWHLEERAIAALWRHKDLIPACDAHNN
jgi:hypothetical protein